jgi:hypothetical protein
MEPLITPIDAAHFSRVFKAQRGVSRRQLMRACAAGDSYVALSYLSFEMLTSMARRAGAVQVVVVCTMELLWTCGLIGPGACATRSGLYNASRLRPPKAAGAGSILARLTNPCFA